MNLITKYRILNYGSIVSLEFQAVYDSINTISEYKKGEIRMIRTKLAKKILTKKEQKHLTESGINSMAALERQMEFNEGKKPFEICLECRSIGNRLSLAES